MLKVWLFSAIKVIQTGSLVSAVQSVHRDPQRTTFLDHGSGAGQANLFYHNRITIAASSSQNLDLRDSLVDPLGNAAVFATVRALRIKALETNVNNVIVGNVTNAFVGPFGAATHSHTLKPGDAYQWESPLVGWNTTAGSNDLIKLANSGSGTSVTLDIDIVGVST